MLPLFMQIWRQWRQRQGLFASLGTAARAWIAAKRLASMQNAFIMWHSVATVQLVQGSRVRMQSWAGRAWASPESGSQVKIRGRGRVAWWIITLLSHVPSLHFPCHLPTMYRPHVCVIFPFLHGTRYIMGALCHVLVTARTPYMSLMYPCPACSHACPCPASHAHVLPASMSCLLS